MQEVHSEPTGPLRGVNLGGWLVLEKWMTPSLFDGLAATDETTWCAELGNDAGGRLRAHWNSFVTRDGFAWLAQTGIDTVRIPFGHWIFGAPYPYHAKYGANPFPYATGGIDVLDRAMRWAEEFGLGVMLDLHAAPGCQNGFDNGGIQNVCEWHTRADYLAHTLAVLERLALRYRGHRALRAIQLLNEPRWDIATDYLTDFYRRAYRAIRTHCAAADVAIVLHDGFRPYSEYTAFLADPAFENVLFDVHRYQCFDPVDLALDPAGHVEKAVGPWRDEARELQRELARPAIVGEWSLGLDIEVVSLGAKMPLGNSLRLLDAFRRDVALRAYGAAQLIAFEEYRGWFFWSYRTETTPEWSFRECVERGWLPRRFD